MNLQDRYRARPYVLDRETAPAFWLVATLWMPMATGVQTGNRLALIDQLMPHGIGPPSHLHPLDEGFYVLEGEITFMAAGETQRAVPGSFVHLPRMTQHTFRVDSPSARVLNFYTPAGFEMILMSVASLARERRAPSKAEAPMPPPDQVMILSRIFGMDKVDLMPFAGPPTEAVMHTRPSPLADLPVHMAHRGSAPAAQAFGAAWRLLAGSAETGGTYNLFEIELPPGGTHGPWLHAQDQAFYVVEGTVSLLLDGQTQSAGPGSFAYVPAGTLNAARAEGRAARLLVFHLPGGLDRAVMHEGAAPAQTQDALDLIGSRRAGAAGW